VRADVLQELDEALGKIDRPGTFCVQGSAPAVLPGLEVDGLGPIGLPLNPGQAKELIRKSAQAPHGKGEKTVVDTKVRRVWRMEPDRFSLTNPQWARFVRETVDKVQQELGLEGQKLTSHLYDLLVYEPGSFFLPHRDGEKLDRMVATLLIVLPSSYEGGELIVRHEGEERTIDFQGGPESAFQVHYAAFYADCEHEIRPVKKGYRLVLVYNLTLAKASKTPITAPRVREPIEAITPLIRRWAGDDASAEKLVITLDHQYTRDGLAWDTLKGADRLKARVLSDAARRAGCRAYLGLLTFHESGSAEGDDDGYRYGRRRRRYYDEDEDENGASGHVMGEIFETSLTAEGLVDAEGRPLPLNRLDVEEAELLDPEALKDVNPEEEFEGYTGNAGMTLDRWYRHAAVIVWPEARSFEILCSKDSRSLIPELDRMVADWKKAKGKDAAATKPRCLDLASAVLAKWQRVYGYGASDNARRDGPMLLKALDALDAPDLIGRFLGEVMVADPSVEPGKAIATVLPRHGWETFRAPLQTLMAGTTAETLERNARLLEQISTAKPRKKEGWSELCEALAEDYFKALETLDRAAKPYDWQLERVKRAGLLADLARALLATGQDDRLAQVVAHVESLPRFYPLTEAQVPALIALQPWLKASLKTRSAALNGWVASTRKQLEALTAECPREPNDFRRPAQVSCKCAECTELKRFLADPKESTHRFRVREERRNHLQHIIQNNKCDLSLKTEKTGSPYSLVCTKNTASYQAALKAYHENQGRLKAIREIEKGLPE
jgi:hypothetical protein